MGRYGVDLEGFERFLGTLPLSSPPPRLVIIDEIGRMECLSKRFRAIIASLLDGPALVIATVALKGSGRIDEVKRRRDVQLYEIMERNRDMLLRDIADRVRVFRASERPEQ